MRSDTPDFLIKQAYLKTLLGLGRNLLTRAGPAVGKAITQAKPLVGKALTGASTVLAKSRPVLSGALAGLRSQGSRIGQGIKAQSGKVSRGLGFGQPKAAPPITPPTPRRPVAPPTPAPAPNAASQGGGLGNKAMNLMYMASMLQGFGGGGGGEIPQQAGAEAAATTMARAPRPWVVGATNPEHLQNPYHRGL